MGQGVVLVDKTAVEIQYYYVVNILQATHSYIAMLMDYSGGMVRSCDHSLT